LLPKIQKFTTPNIFIIRLIRCLYPEAQAQMALADLIRQFSAYEWMQPNGYKIVCFVFDYAAHVSLMQATKQELR
jgi:hypothetical protein